MGGAKVLLHLFSTSTLNGGDRCLLGPCRFTPRKEPRWHWKGGSVGPVVCLDVSEKRKSLAFAGIRTRDLLLLALLLYQLYTFTRALINCWNGWLSYQRKCLTIFDQVLDLSSLNSRLSMTPHESHVLCSRLCKWISCSHAFVTLDALLCLGSRWTPKHL